jgi:tetratricopeptide (TPR) repeat protein
MIPNQFAPQSTAPRVVSNPEPVAINATPIPDGVSGFLANCARLSVVGLAFLLPIFFLPGLWGTLGFQKSFLALICVALVVIVGSLLALRTREVTTILPIPIAVFMGFLGVAVTSAVTSVDTLAALRGSVFEVQTVAFMVLLLGVMSVPLVLQHSKRFMFFACAALGLGLGLLLLYASVRLFVGPILPFGSFASVTQSPAGNFNDLALLAGLAVVLGVITLLQLKLRPVVQGLLAAVIVLALLIMAAVNFLYVWIVVGFFGLIVLLYVLSFEHLFSDASTKIATQSRSVVLAVATLICVCSAIFIIAGNYTGQWFAEQFDVEYLEVRPSVSANIDIARGVYTDGQMLLGVGPNQYESAWREHKDSAINETLFWNTDFVAGSGYVPTLFVTVGLLGGLAFVLFTLSYLWLGVRTLLRPSAPNSFWYFASLVTFTGSVFLWGMSYVYVPGATVLLLAALLTGLTFASLADLQPTLRKTVPLVTNHKRGFIVMAVVILCITGGVFVLFSTGEQYVAQSSFNKSQLVSTDVAAIDQAAMRSFAMYPDDQFLGVRAQVALFEMNRLLAVAEPVEADQQRFVVAAEQALLFTNAAIASSPHNPTYQALLATIFNNYAVVGVVGALERSQTALTEAAALDPKNPLYALMRARMAAQRGDVEAARSAVTQALQQRRNFTEALFLLTEIDIAAGDVPAAIETTRTIITLEPQNPARHYQLGILYTAAEQPSEALAAYQVALTLDPGFANARYLRALLLVDLQQIESALQDLRLVAQTNTDNEQLISLIAALESGEIPSVPTVSGELVDELSQPRDGATVNSDTDLVTPLNTVPSQTVEPVVELTPVESVDAVPVSDGDEAQESPAQ